MKCVTRLLISLLLLNYSSCVPPAPAPPDTKGTPKPATYPTNGVPPAAFGTGTQIGAGTLGSGTIVTGPGITLPSPEPRPADFGSVVTQSMNAITSLIDTIQSGGDFKAIFGSVTNLVSAFTGGQGGGGALSGFGNLLGSLISGQPTVTSPTIAPTQTK